MIWVKKDIFKLKGGLHRYEYVNAEGITIDVNIGSTQGFAGSNAVNVYGLPKYGGWILGTPRMFKTKKEVSAFVSYAKKQIQQGKYGKKVAWLD